MKSIDSLKQDVTSGAIDKTFATLYGKANVAEAQTRYIKLINRFAELFPRQKEAAIFSVPGRTEVGGNHTDHQHGCVLAGSVNLDIIAVASLRNDSKITIFSEGFSPDTVDFTDLTPHQEEFGKSAGLIRGVCAGFVNRGYKIGGFDTYMVSNVLKGSGLSSSAAYEVLIGTILNHLYNHGKIDAVTIAQIAQFAEREFFGKPCGLMDQTACSVGGFVAIDFADPEKPIVKRIDFNFADCGHELVIVDTRGDHVDLTQDYADIGVEMRAVAAFFGKKVLRDVNPAEFYENLGVLRQKVSLRAILRAIHFFGENQRAQTEAKLLEEGNFDAFKKVVLESGESSYTLLQNVYSATHTDRQEIPLALTISKQLLDGKGAWRVHGGGFAGTIQAFVPANLTESYCKAMEQVFGEGCCYVLFVRPEGAVRIA